MRSRVAVVGVGSARAARGGVACHPGRVVIATGLVDPDGPVPGVGGRADLGGGAVAVGRRRRVVTVSPTALVGLSTSRSSHHNLPLAGSNVIHLVLLRRAKAAKHLVVVELEP